MIYRIIAGVAVSFFATWTVVDIPDRVPAEGGVVLASSEAEARSRALLLYEMAQGALQVMHRDFFDKDNTRGIPSASLEDVFKEMDESFGVKMKWLTVNTDIVNFEHEAKTEFEKTAVKSLVAGKPFVEDASATEYQFAGPIRLRSQCLGCHLKSRSSNEDRTAGLVILMPLASSKKQ